MAKSARFDTLKARYERDGCRKDQLAQFVQLEALAPDEYEKITGEKYEE